MLWTTHLTSTTRFAKRGYGDSKLYDLASLVFDSVFQTTYPEKKALKPTFLDLYKGLRGRIHKFKLLKREMLEN
jgi:hypothetical protein